MAERLKAHAYEQAGSTAFPKGMREPARHLYGRPRSIVKSYRSCLVQKTSENIIFGRTAVRK